MDKNKRNTKAVSVLSSAVFTAMVTVLPGLALGEPWEVELIADVGAIYTDNISLESEGLEDSDTVFVIAPSLALTTDGDSLVADIRYRPEALFYNDASDFDEVFHIVDANMTAAVVPDALFVFANALHYQSIVSPEFGFPTSNLPITDNRVDSTILELRPYWEQDLGFADILLEYSYVDSRFEDPPDFPSSEFQDNVAQSGNFVFNNRELQQGFAWGLEYEYRQVEYELANDWEYQRAAVDLGYWFNGVTRVFVLGGAESPYDDFFESKLEDEFWEVGFQYVPSQRLNLELAAGERGYGDSYRARISYQLRRGQTELEYTEEALTRAEIAVDRRPIFIPDNLDGFLDRPGDFDRFIQKRGQWQTTIELAKSQITLRAFSEERDQRTTDSGLELPDELFYGAAFRWAWQLGVNSTLGMTADIVHSEVDNAESDLTRLALDYTLRLSQKLSIVMLAQRSEEDGEDVFGLDYTENQYHLMLRTEFL